MSAAASARSPSPGSVARPCFGLRRSADSSPFRQIASTPDSPQRSASVGKNRGGGRASSRAEKENDSHDHRDAPRTPKAARYSTGGGGGVAKSFMAPTISASSKAVAASASPRKKVLGERNDGLPHPVPSSPGELLSHGKPRGPPPPLTQPEEALGAPRRLRLSLDGAHALPPPAAAPLVSHGAGSSLSREGGEEVEKNPVCLVHRHDESGDAAAPYDPKTNYLSPRPKFLRYRPNPRIEYLRSGGGSARRFEDGLASSSESSEEADAATTTEEEEPSEEEQESSPLAPSSDASDDPVGPVAASVLTLEHAPVSPPPRAPTTEPVVEPTTSPRARSPTPEPEEPAVTAVRAPAKKKKRSSLRFLLVAPLALVLFMVASFVCMPPPPGSPVVLNTSLSKVSDYFLSVQELHPVELAAWLKHWSSSSLDYVVSYWNALASSGEQEFFGPHAAANLSAAVADDEDHGVGFYYSAAETRTIPTKVEPIPAGVFELQEVVSASYIVATAEEMATLGDATVEDDSEVVEESVLATSSVIEELNEYGDGLVVEELLNAEMAEEVSDSSGEEMTSFSQDLDIPSQSDPEAEHTVNDKDAPSLQQDVQTDESEGDQKAHVKEDQEHHAQKMGSDAWSGYLDKFSNPAVAGSVFAVLIVSAVCAFLYMRQNQARVSLNPNEPAEQVEQVETQSGSGSSEGRSLAKGSHFQYPVVEETERIGDSGASHFQSPVVEETGGIGGSGTSQYSSSLTSGLGRRRKYKVEQNLQNESTSRRDSTSSYGSFTTYEKISAKKKNKEDEAMTPVRRSSRLRNQAQSPEA